MNEKNYLEYRESHEDDEKANFNEPFLNERSILVISEDGEKKQIKTESYHFKSLFQRFSYLDGADPNNEYVTSVVAAKNGYVVFIVDPLSLCMFIPSALSGPQKNTLLNILTNINSSSGAFAEIVPYLEDGDIIEVGEGLETKINQIIEEIEKFTVIREIDQFNIKK